MIWPDLHVGLEEYFISTYLHRQDLVGKEVGKQKEARRPFVSCLHKNDGQHL